MITFYFVHPHWVLKVYVTEVYVYVTLLKVYVTVLDSNDHRPSFSHPTYEFKLGENTSPGTTIFTLKASDKDLDQHLVYFLENTAHVPSQNKFKVDAVSGDIILNEPLDR